MDYAVEVLHRLVNLPARGPAEEQLRRLRAAGDEELREAPEEMTYARRMFRRLQEA